MNPKALVLLFGTLCAIPTACSADVSDSSRALEKARLCEARWDEFHQRQGQALSLQARLDWWLAQEDDCGGTGIFEFRAASLYRAKGDLKAAEKLLDRAVREGRPFGGINKVLLLSNEFDQIILSDEPRKKQETQVMGIVSLVEQLIEDYPEAADFGLEHLCSMYTWQTRYKKAESCAARILASHPESAVGHRTLVIALGNQRQYERAERHILPAIRAHAGLASDVDFMFWSVLTYAERGKFEAAESALLTLAEKQPWIKEEDRFRRLAHAIQQRGKIGTR